MPRSVSSVESYMSDDESRGSQSSVEEESYIYNIIQDIIEEWPENQELNDQEIFNQLVEKAKHNHEKHQAMENDDLWQDIIGKANTYQGKMCANISDKASIEMAIEKYKPAMMEEITRAIDAYCDDNGEQNSSDESEEDEEEEEDVTDGANNVSTNQVGGRQQQYNIHKHHPGRYGEW